MHKDMTIPFMNPAFRNEWFAATPRIATIEKSIRENV